MWKVFLINIVYHKNYHYEIYEILGERVVAQPPENHSFPDVAYPFVPSACSDRVAIFGGCAEQLELRGILQSSRAFFF